MIGTVERAIGAVVGVAFAFFCAWLTVRIFNLRAVWAKRLAVGIIAALMAYPLSYGPAVYLNCKYGSPPFWLPFGETYRPRDLAVDYGPSWLSNAVLAYQAWWTPPLSEEQVEREFQYVTAHWTELTRDIKVDPVDPDDTPESD